MAELKRSPVFDEAVKLAATGQPVFPVNQHKIPELWRSDGLNRGLTDATTDLETIEQMWQYGESTAWLGLATGHLVDVLDLDNCPSDQPGWGITPLPDTRVVMTPRGGLHLYFLASGTRNRVEVVPGADWRGLGGYVVAPPSPGYTLMTDDPPAVIPPALRPETKASGISLSSDGWRHGIELLRSDTASIALGTQDSDERTVRAAFASILAEFAQTRTGRNDALFSAAYAASRFRGVDPRPILVELAEIAATLPSETVGGFLGAGEIQATIGSAVARRAALQKEEVA